MPGVPPELIDARQRRRGRVKAKFSRHPVSETEEGSSRAVQGQSEMQKHQHFRMERAVGNEDFREKAFRRPPAPFLRDVAPLEIDPLHTVLEEPLELPKRQEVAWTI